MANKKNKGPSLDRAYNTQAANTKRPDGSPNTFSRIRAAQQIAHSQIGPAPRDQYEAFIKKIQAQGLSQQLIGQAMSENPRLDPFTAKKYSDLGSKTRFKSLVEEGKRLNAINPELSNQLADSELPVDSKTASKANAEKIARYEEYRNDRDAQLKAAGFDPETIKMDTDIYNIKNFMKGDYTKSYNASAAWRAAGLNPKDAEFNAGAISGIFDKSKFTPEELEALKQGNEGAKLGSNYSGQKENSRQRSNFQDFTGWLSDRKDDVWDNRFYGKAANAVGNTWFGKALKASSRDVIDNLSRPAYAVSGMAKELSSLDKDTNRKDQQEKYAYRQEGEGFWDSIKRNTGINSVDDLVPAKMTKNAIDFMSGGINPLSGLDEALSDPDKLKKVLHEGGKGFDLKEKDWWGDVVSQNAAKIDSNNSTILSNPWYQTYASFTGGMVTDPMSYAGPGVANAAVKGIKGISKATGVTGAARVINDSRATKIRDEALKTINESKANKNLTPQEAREARSAAWTEYLRRTNKKAYWEKIERPATRMAKALADQNIITYGDIKGRKGTSPLKNKGYDDDTLLTEEDFSYLLGVGRRPSTRRAQHKYAKQMAEVSPTLQGANIISKSKILDKMADLRRRHKEDTARFASDAIRDEDLYPETVEDAVNNVDTSMVVEGNPPDYVKGEGEDDWDSDSGEVIPNTTMSKDLGLDDGPSEFPFQDDKSKPSGLPFQDNSSMPSVGTTFTHNELYNEVSSGPPSSLPWKFSYDENGNLTRNRKGFSPEFSQKLNEWGIDEDELLSSIDDFFSGKLGTRNSKVYSAYKDAVGRYRRLIGTPKKTDKVDSNNKPIWENTNPGEIEASKASAKINFKDIDPEDRETAYNLSNGGMDSLRTAAVEELNQIFTAVLGGRIRAMSSDVAKLRLTSDKGFTRHDAPQTDPLKKTFFASSDDDAPKLEALFNLHNQMIRIIEGDEATKLVTPTGDVKDILLGLKGSKGASLAGLGDYSSPVRPVRQGEDVSHIPNRTEPVPGGGISKPTNTSSNTNIEDSWGDVTDNYREDQYGDMTVANPDGDGFDITIEDILDDLKATDYTSDEYVLARASGPNAAHFARHVLRLINKELKDNHSDFMGDDFNFDFDKDVPSALKNSDGTGFSTEVRSALDSSVISGDGSYLIKISDATRRSLGIKKGSSEDKALNNVVRIINASNQKVISSMTKAEPIKSPAGVTSKVTRNLETILRHTDPDDPFWLEAQEVSQYWDPKRGSLYFKIGDRTIYLTSGSLVPMGTKPKRLSEFAPKAERDARNAEIKAWNEAFEASKATRVGSVAEQMEGLVTPEHQKISSNLNRIIGQAYAHHSARTAHVEYDPDSVPYERPRTKSSKGGKKKGGNARISRDELNMEIKGTSHIPPAPSIEDMKYLYDWLRKTGGYKLPRFKNFLKYKEGKWFYNFIQPYNKSESRSRLNPEFIALTQELVKSQGRHIGDIERSKYKLIYGSEYGVDLDEKRMVNSEIAYKGGTDEVITKNYADTESPVGTDSLGSKMYMAPDDKTRDFAAESRQSFYFRVSKTETERAVKANMKGVLDNISTRLGGVTARDVEFKKAGDKTLKIERVGLDPNGDPVSHEVHVPINEPPKTLKDRQESQKHGLKKIQERESTLAKEALDSESDPDIKSDINEYIRNLNAKHSEEMSRLESALTKAEKADKIIKRTLDEDALARIITLPNKYGGFTGRLSNWAYEGYLDVPGFSQMIKAMERINSPEYLQRLQEKSGLFRNQIVKAATSSDPDRRLAYSNMFENFSNFSRASTEVQDARSKYSGQTAEIIAQHINRLQKLRTFSRNQRVAALKALSKDESIAVETPAIKAIRAELERLLPTITEARKKGLSTSDILRYSHKDFNLKSVEIDALLNDKTNVSHLADILFRSMRSKHRNGTDPMIALWRMNISVEQSIAFHTLKNDIRSMGIPLRGTNIEDKGIGGVFSNGEFLSKSQQDAVRRLRAEYGYRTIEGFENTLFHPDLIPEISKLMTITDPRNQGQILDLFDAVQRIWKMSVTIYNPAYYTNNLYGEILAGYYGGVKSAKRYYDAAFVMRSARKAKANDNPDFLSRNGFDEYRDRTDTKDRRRVVVRRNREELDQTEAALLYQEHGLGSTFINTEVKHGMNQIPGLSRVNDKVRGLGEFSEDIPRMAHFLDAMNKAPSHLNMKEAASYAAEQVRKYHFDYSDVSKFEKTVLMRVFPFYTFTRKVIPLYAQMIFQRPGRLLTMPKAYAAAMEGFGPQVEDEQGVTDGLNPNYDAIGTSQWVRDAGGMPFPLPGFGNTEDGIAYHRPQDPLGQAMVRVDQPGYTAGMLANPALKLLDKLGQPDVKKWNEQQNKMETVNPFWDQLTKDTIPQTKLAEEFGNWKGAKGGRRKENREKFFSTLLGTGMNRDYQ